MNEKPRFNVVSLSGGKDSTAMFLRMIEKGIKIDCALFCDTGLEFPAMYRHIERLEKDTGIHIDKCASDLTFEYMMFEKPIKRKAGSSFEEFKNGYSWPGPRARWCTEKLKNGPRTRFLMQLKQRYDVYEHVGLAADEKYRLERKNNMQINHVHPLVEWGMTEKDCLEYCYRRGYDWEGIYEHFGRVSCWCCPLQSLEELRKLRKFYPDLWEKLNEMDKRSVAQFNRTFKDGYSVEQLGRRFDLEERFIEDGKSIKSKEFFMRLREVVLHDG